MGNSRHNPIAQLARRGDFAGARALKVKSLVRTEAALQMLLRGARPEHRDTLEQALRSVTGLVTPDSGSKPAETPTHNEPGNHPIGVFP